MQNFEGWNQLKQFGIFFLGVVVGSFCTIILFFYGCFKSSTGSSKPATSSTPISSEHSESSLENLESQRPPPYSSLKFDKKPKPCQCCRLISGLHCKNLFRK